MASDHHGTVLGDFFDLQRGTTYKSMLKGQSGPVLLGLASIRRNGGFRQDKLTTYGGDSPERLLVRTGELFVSLKDVTQSGDLLGAVAKVPIGVKVGRLTQDTVKLIPRSADTPLEYLYWILRVPAIRQLCRSRATGTTNLGLAREDFLSIPVPPLTDARREVVALLGALDEKIELNRKMNRTLEEIAQAIFKYWFIDFEGVPHEDLVESELGPIPKGWEVKPVQEVAKIVGGSTPATKNAAYWDGGTIHWTTPKDLSSASTPVLLDTARKITEAGLAKISSGLLPVGTLLMSSRAPVGYLAIAEVPVAVNQGYIAMPPGGRLSSLFMLHWASVNMDRIKARAGGTTFAEISKRNFRPIPTVVPNQESTLRFDSTVGPVHARVVSSERESSILTELRDALLPKLISGEIRMPEAEKQAAALL